MIGVGFIIFKIDDLKSSKPIRRMRNDTISPEMYSILPWPNGWSVSGLFPPRRKPKRVTKDEPASERLLKASAVTEMAPERVPATNLIINKSTFNIIPKALERVP